MTFIHPFRYIHIPILILPSSARKGVRDLDVSMANSLAVEIFQSLDTLDHISPDHVLVDILPATLVSLHLFVTRSQPCKYSITMHSSVSLFSRKASRTYDVFVANRCKKTNLIQCIGDLFFRHFVDFYTFKCVYLIITLANYL